MYNGKGDQFSQTDMVILNLHKPRWCPSTPGKKKYMSQNPIGLQGEIGKTTIYSSNLTK